MPSGKADPVVQGAELGLGKHCALISTSVLLLTMAGAWLYATSAGASPLAAALAGAEQRRLLGRRLPSSHPAQAGPLDGSWLYAALASAEHAPRQNYTILSDDCDEDCSCAEYKCKACPSQITHFEGACWCTGCNTPAPTPPLLPPASHNTEDPFADINAQIDAIKCEVDGDCSCEKKKCELCEFTRQDIVHFEDNCWCLGCK
jgi:hypothetical protein